MLVCVFLAAIKESKLSYDIPYTILLTIYVPTIVI